MQRNILCFDENNQSTTIWAFETYRAPIGRGPSGTSGKYIHRAHRANMAIGQHLFAFLDYKIQCPSGAKIPSGFCLHRARFAQGRIHFASCNQDHRAWTPIGLIGHRSPSGLSGIQLHRANRAIGRYLAHRALDGTPLKYPSEKKVHRAFHRAK